MSARQSESAGAPARFDTAGVKVLAALFHDVPTATRAVHALKAAGFVDDQIGLAMRDTIPAAESDALGTRAPEEAVRGALGGGLLGALAGLLVGLGVVAIPGLGPLVAGGAMASGLSAAGATAAAGAGIGAAAGGLFGALIGLEIPEVEARYFEAGVRAGQILVTVRTAGRFEEAVRILGEHGADRGPSASGEQAQGTIVI